MLKESWRQTHRFNGRIVASPPLPCSAQRCCCRPRLPWASQSAAVQAAEEVARLGSQFVQNAQQTQDPVMAAQELMADAAAAQAS